MKLNLLDQNRVGIFGEMDVIFCRNVMIYFDLEAKKKIIENFYQKLRKRRLFVARSFGIVDGFMPRRLYVRHLKNDMVYQK